MDTCAVDTKRPYHFNNGETCIADGCLELSKTRELCALHYSRLLRQKRNSRPENVARDLACAKALNRTPKARFTKGGCQAKRRGVLWEVTFSEYCELINCACFYCHGPLNETGIGLDQIIPGCGYTTNNVLPCCGDCNELKGDHLSVEETLALVAHLKIIRGGVVWNYESTLF